MNCTSIIIILSATSMTLGWLVYYLKQAIGAQKTALGATRATVDALKAQSDLRIEPLKDTIGSKDGTIEALEAQLALAAERKALIEDKLTASQELLNRLLAELPSDGAQLIRAEVDKERAVTFRIAGNMFYNAGYFTGVANLAVLILQIQALAFRRHEEENLEPKRAATLVAVEYMKDSTLFLYRERRLALENTIKLLSGPEVKIPALLTEQLDQLSAFDKMALENGLKIDAEAAQLSSIKDFPTEII